MVASILKIVITRNTICNNLVGFPKSGHTSIYRYITIFTTAMQYNMANREYRYIAYIAICNILQYAIYCNVVLGIVLFLAD